MSEPTMTDAEAVAQLESLSSQQSQYADYYAGAEMPDTAEHCRKTAAALRRALAWHDALRRVRALHIGDGSEPFERCAECAERKPCSTLRAIDGMEAR